MEVGSISIFLGNLPPDHAQGQAAEEHEKADRQKTWSHDFGLPTPVLIKNESKTISICNNFALLQLMPTLNCTTSIRYYHTLVVFVVCIVKVLTSKKTKYKTSLLSPLSSRLSIQSDRLSFISSYLLVRKSLILTLYFTIIHFFHVTCLLRNPLSVFIQLLSDFVFFILHILLLVCQEICFV